MKARLRSVFPTTLPRGPVEALLIVGLYLGSELSRGLASGGAAVAQAHAQTVVRIERHLHVFSEGAVQHAAHRVTALPTLLGYAYVSLHMLATAALLVWVYRRHRAVYPLLRNTLVVANALAVVGYWAFPTAPPRLAGVGIADTVSGATSINLTSNVASAFYNPYAAVPSMHIGFSLLVGVTIVLLAQRRLVRIAGALYPLFVLFVIVATGNHFFLDAAAGALVAILAGTLVLASARVRATVQTGYAASAAYGARAPLMIRS
jgi:hypothetical protein